MLSIYICKGNRKRKAIFTSLPCATLSNFCVILHLFSCADFTFIYSKFIGPLPPTVDEFVSSVREVFPNVVDVSHMMNGIGSLRRVYNVPVDIFYPNSAPTDVQFPHQGPSLFVNLL